MLLHWTPLPKISGDLFFYSSDWVKRLMRTKIIWPNQWVSCCTSWISDEGTSLYGSLWFEWVFSNALPFKWSHGTILDLMWCDALTEGFKSFLHRDDFFFFLFFPVKTMRSFLQQRTLAPLWHVLFRDDIMLLEALSFTLHWRSCEAQTGLKKGKKDRRRECSNGGDGDDQQPKHFSFQKLCTFPVPASGDFPPNFCEAEPLSHIVYPPTQASAHLHRLTPVMSFPHG